MTNVCTKVIDAGGAHTAAYVTMMNTRFMTQVLVASATNRNRKRYHDHFSHGLVSGELVATATSIRTLIMAMGRDNERMIVAATEREVHNGGDNR